VRFAPTGTGSASATLTVAGNKRAATATDSLSGTSRGHIYWANVLGGTIWEADLSNPSDTTQIASGQSLPAGVAVGP
jgi:hypothetical protein